MFKNEKNMKKFIIIGTLASINIAILGAVCKVLHWPGASIFLTIGIGLFCFVFFPLALIQAYRDSNRTQKPLYIVGFICTVIVFVGALFKIMHWPGAGFLLIIGIPLPFVLFLPLYIFYHSKSKEKSILNLLGVMFLMVFIAIFSSILALNVSYDVLKNYQSTYSDIEKTNKLMGSRIEMLYASLEAMENDSIKNKTALVKKNSETIYRFIDETKEALVRAVNEEVPFLDADGKIDIENVANLSETVQTSFIMHGHDEISGASVELKELLNQCQSSLQKVVHESANRKSIKELLNIDNKLVDGFAMSWEKTTLPSGAFLITLLGNLESIKTTVLMAEQQALLGIQ
jgi:hypothetical protein